MSLAVENDGNGGGPDVDQGNGGRTDNVRRPHKPIRVEDFNFLRPPLNIEHLGASGRKEPLKFFILDIDTTNSVTNQWDVEKRFDETVRPNFWQFYVRLSGVTSLGHSVTCYVSGFKPYVYLQTPPHWNLADVNIMLRHIERTVAPRQQKAFNASRDVSAIEKTWRTQVYGYTNNEKIVMFKLGFNNEKMLKLFIKLLDNDRTLQNFRGMNHEFWLWDACVPPRSQFSNVHDIMPSYWVTLDPDSYTYRDAPSSRRNVLLPPEQRRSRAQIDVDCPVTGVRCDKDCDDVPPLLLSSWDIEVAGKPGIFPEPAKADDPIIQIAVTVQRYGAAQNNFCYQCCFCLRETDNPMAEDKDVTLFWFEKEAQLIEAFYYFLFDSVDPDIDIAYNRFGFDDPYFYNRALKLLPHMIPANVRDGTAPYYKNGALDFGRYRNERTAMKSNFSDSKAHGGTTKYTIENAGRVVIDLYAYGREHMGMVVGLNKMSETFLGANEQKDDIHHSLITPMFLESAEKRGLLAKYCVRDTELPLMILHKKCVVIEQVEKSRLTGVTLQRIINRKQTVRVESVIFRYTHNSAERYAIPQEPLRFITDPHMLALFNGEHEREGALVLPAQPNFYEQPIATLDFASLYPSIIRGMKLCFSRLILEKRLLATTPHRHDVVRCKDVTKKPYDFFWAADPDPDTKPLFYRILTELLNARALAKKKRKEHAPGTFMYSVLDSRQLALKVVANSTYGYTLNDPAKCKLPFAAIGVTVTHYGRLFINMTRDEVHRRVPGSLCIYGDTDSVMIKFNDDSSPEAFQQAFTVGKHLATEISKLFPPEVVLEFEKVFYPYILYQQKNYAGIKYEDPDEKGKVKCSGLASVKGTTIGFVKRWTEDVVEMMMTDRNAHRAKRYLLDELQRFVEQPVKSSDVSISMRMSKEIGSYAEGNQVASVVAAMVERDPGSAPKAGDKVRFLHCIDKKSGNALPIDVDYYEENKERYRIDKLHYLNKLMRQNMGKLFDLPSVAADPYQWFSPFANAIKCQSNGGGMSRFLKRSRPPTLAAPALQPPANATEDPPPTDIDRSRYPMSLFRNGKYTTTSAVKKARVKKATDKHVKDECRRLHISKAQYQTRARGATGIDRFFRKKTVSVTEFATAQRERGKTLAAETPTDNSTNQ